MVTELVCILFSVTAQAAILPSVTAFAKITPKAGRQIFNESTGERVQNPHTFEFLIRYRSGITTTMRILFGSRTFDIVKINNENDYNNFITLTAIENVGT